MKAAFSAAAAAALLPIALFACFGSDPGDGGPRPVRNCAELSDSVFPGADSLGPPEYKILAPNGGESLKVGDTLRVRLTGAGGVGASTVEIWRFSKAGNRYAKLPGAPPQSFDPRATCGFAFAIPDSLSSETGAGGKFSLVSDSLKIRIAHYTAGADYFDFSDSLFSIAK